jgi:hypothetical protein
MAGLRQTRPQSSQPPRLSDFPWFDSRCVVLKSQLRRAKLLSRSPEVRLLQRRYRSKLRRSKAAGNQRDILSLSQLLKSKSCQFWRKASLPHSMLPPTELQTPSAWDEYLANLTAPPVHIADQLPLPHTP